MSDYPRDAEGRPAFTFDSEQLRKIDDFAKGNAKAAIRVVALPDKAFLAQALDDRGETKAELTINPVER